MYIFIWVFSLIINLVAICVHLINFHNAGPVWIFLVLLNITCAAFSVAMLARGSGD